jgi:uncharacterized protein (DUF3084 family)
VQRHGEGGVDNIRGVVDALIFATIGTLIVSVVSLVIAVLILRNVRRSAELAEDRVEYLREEQARLAFVREERRSLEEELKREREQRLEAEQRAERLREEHTRLGQELGQTAEEREQLRAQQREEEQELEGWEHEGHTQEHAGLETDQHSESGLQEQPPEVQQGSASPREEKPSTEPENAHRVFRNIFRRR